MGDLGRLWVVLGVFEIAPFSYIANDGLREAPGADFGSISTRFWKHVGTDLDAFG